MFDLLQQVMPDAGSRAVTFAPFIAATVTEFGITSPRRLAAFIAQIAHESGQLRYTREIASGAQYEDRADLGNVQPGDGMRFRGRGLIQITGRANYRELSGACGIDFVQLPELLETPEYAARSAGWFWRKRLLNTWADTDQFGALTKRINGGYTGLDDRLSFWLRARKFLNVEPL